VAADHTIIKTVSIQALELIELLVHQRFVWEQENGLAMLRDCANGRQLTDERFFRSS